MVAARQTPPDDWYRSDAWDESARKLFETKLARARSSRSQYLRIKGLALVATDDHSRIEAGRRLLRRVIEEHPDDAMQVAGAHYALGDSYARNNQYPPAQEHLRACLEVEDGHGFSHGTELRLAEVLVDDQQHDALDEAWELLDEAARQGPHFNSTIWRIEVTRARALARAGHDTAAAVHASQALALLDCTEPQLPRHPDVGLIDADEATVQQLRRLI